MALMTERVNGCAGCSTLRTLPHALTGSCDSVRPLYHEHRCEASSQVKARRTMSRTVKGLIPSA